jgi:asparagine synthase (glutamine-hydrolysing)
MCGIAGIIGKISETNRSALRKMNAALAHRGPDGEGSWQSPADESGRGVLLTHRRLSILDLTPAGAQPMIDPVTGDVIVFNGEIYNYLELRNRINGASQELQSTGDTAVALRLLGVDGAEAVAAFRGMFAFAYWDTSERRLLLVRDPLGIKPLYVARNPDRDGDWSVLFASEIRGLLAAGLIGGVKLNPTAVASVVWNGFVVGPDTAVDGIESLSPGQLCVFDAASREETSRYYWKMPVGDSPYPVGARELSSALDESVRLHLLSDVPVAVFLSSGIDSAAVANLAQRTSMTPIHTFTLTFEEPEFNEGVHSRQIAEAIHAEHREIVLTEHQFVEQLDSALASLDHPTFDGLNSYYMARAVREAGFKVALVGTGGDELFGGYTSFRDLPTLMRWGQRTRSLPRPLIQSLARLVARVLQPARSGTPQQTRWAKLPDMVQHSDDLLSLYQLAYALFLPDFQRRLLNPDIAELVADGLSPAIRSRLALERPRQAHHTLAAISILEQRLFLGERLLPDTDVASMASSVEVRLPLVDQGLLDSVYRMDERDRFCPIRQKMALRRAGLLGLQPQLFERPKTGFVLPFDRWIRARLGNRMDEVMRDDSLVRATGLDPGAVSRLWSAFRADAPGVYWSRVWALYVFIHWCHRHRVLL